MEEPGFDDYSRMGREIKDRAHDMEHAIRHMEHDIRHVERERMRAIKNAMKNEMGNARNSSPGPRTVEEVLVEIDSYLSYLEDLPAEKLAPHENKINDVAGHLEKLRSSLTRKP
ncbi:MAG TPA: hypothetical protein VMC84_11395 [Methanocella sp.]|uniref:hypothetical protein n=1 Tax=Methanocella sp. TaxID=2052833 RepID=UPI002BF3BDCC|nr:hypothetical protein [Methanocella sp.]HTY91771.1 hypothetical protein [Methanocella sp.]